MAIDAIRTIMNQVRAYTEAARVERYRPQDALVMDPVPSPLEAHRAEIERQGETRADVARQNELRGEVEDERERSSQRRADENRLMGMPGQRVDRYA